MTWINSYGHLLQNENGSSLIHIMGDLQCLTSKICK
jgi:hypothetical protein